jgi:hypothetical protein
VKSFSPCPFSSFAAKALKGIALLIYDRCCCDLLLFIDTTIRF